MVTKEENLQKTELGYFPNDWKIEPLGKFVRITSGESPSRFKFQNEGVPYFKVEQLNNGKKYARETKYFIKSDSLVAKGSIIFPKRGASIFLNKIRILENASFMDTNLMTLTVNDEIDNEYLFYQLSYIGLSRIADTTSIPQINNKHINPFLFPLPPTKIEQASIANVLNDVDNFIDQLEKLISKKRVIKQGAMQELLKPKKGWVLRRLGDISKIKTGKKNNEDKIEDGIYPFFVRSQTVERINSYSHDGEAILIPGEGNIGSVIHYINGRFDYHQRVYKISDFDNEVSGKYIYFCMFQYFNKHAMKYTVKATVDSLRLPAFLEFEIYFPESRFEQDDIASILSDIDAEIEILEKRLEKHKVLKQGMMQSLLTGKIRLV